MNRLEELRIRQLDETLRELQPLRVGSAPEDGWVRTVREALGMTIRQLAARAGLSKTAVASIEKNEVSRSARLESIDRLAAAMECEVVYAVVPRTSLDQILKRRARYVAENLVTRVSDSMHLEMQGTPEAEQERLINELAENLRSELGRLWDV